MDGDALSAHIKAIDEKLDGFTPINAEENCIFKVHEQLLKVNENAYKPVLLSIGPYNNHCKVGQKLMEEHKLRYLKQMLRTRIDHSVKEFIEVLRELEGRARKCYAECISLTKDEFVEMMLLDGCFIIELFRKSKEQSPEDEHDPIFQMSWMLPSISRDLLLFENQLPFFVLTTLFLMIESSQTPLPNQSEHLGEHTIKIEQNNGITFTESSTSKDQSDQIRRFVDLAFRFFNVSSSCSTEKIKHLLCRTNTAITPPLAEMVHEHLQAGHKFENKNFKHLLDLIHTIIRLSVLDMELDRAKKCQEVGFNFKKGEIFKNLFGLIRRVASPLLAKMENMKKGRKKKSTNYAIQLEESTLPYSPKRNEDWNSIPYGTQLQKAGVKFEMALKFRDKFQENKAWKLFGTDVIAFQEAEIELEKAKKFLRLLEERNEADKKGLCPTTFKMVEKFMSLPFLDKIECWNSIPEGRELKKAGVEFKKAKKFRDIKDMIQSSIPNATELKESGVSFEKAKEYSLFAIQFSNGVLEISSLPIDDEFETLFRNLIAFELYSPYNDSSYVTDYMCFMDALIDSPKDVELLRRKGIIENGLGDDKFVANMVNKLGRHVDISTNNSIYAKTCIDLNRHCAKRWNERKAKLRHNYFNSPWALLSVLAAILLLGLAITQTVFSIIN